MDPATSSRTKKGSKKDDSHEGGDTFVFSTDALISEIQRKAASVFEVFDQNKEKVVDVREVGTMVRALDLYPTEADVHEIIGFVEEPTMKGMVKYGTFINHMTKVICEGKYKPVPYEDLLTAFRAIDKDRKGVLEPKKLRDILTREGESFTAEEVDEMLHFAIKKSEGKIIYDEYVEKLYRTLNI